MQYDSKKAEQFWTRRVSEVDEMRAVLSWRAPHYVNASYSNWELGLLLRDLGDIRGRRVVDIGCGVGRVTMELLKAGARVTALDNSAKMLSITKEKARAALLQDAFEGIKCNAAENPLPDVSYDIAVCVGLLEHLPLVVRVKALDHLYRILKFGGHAYLVINNNESIFLKSDRLYDMKEQQSDGFFVGVIGLSFIQDFFAKHRAKVSLLGGNSLYSYVRHTLSSLDMGERLDPVAAELLQLATAADLHTNGGGEDARYVADQFLVRIDKSIAGSSGAA